MLKGLSGYQGLIKNIGEILARGRQCAYVAVDNILIETYWNVGREIVEYEQKGNERADYGSELLRTLARDLKTLLGSGNWTLGEIVPYDMFPRTKHMEAVAFLYYNEAVTGRNEKGPHGTP